MSDNEEEGQLDPLDMATVIIHAVRYPTGKGGQEADVVREIEECRRIAKAIARLKERESS